MALDTIRSLASSVLKLVLHLIGMGNETEYGKIITRSTREAMHKAHDMSVEPDVHRRGSKMSDGEVV